MANQTATEQLVLELINRARLDPLAEALRFGIALNEGVPAGSTISSAAKQPLAMNDQLLAAAHGHSEAMVNDPTPPPNSRDFFEHNNPHTGSTSQSRIEDSGYVWSNGRREHRVQRLDRHDRRGRTRGAGARGSVHRRGRR